VYALNEADASLAVFVEEASLVIFYFSNFIFICF